LEGHKPWYKRKQQRGIGVEEIENYCKNKNIDFNIVNILNDKDILDLVYGNVNRAI
jgi:hypothetical protein